MKNKSQKTVFAVRGHFKIKILWVILSPIADQPDTTVPQKYHEIDGKSSTNTVTSRQVYLFFHTPINQLVFEAYSRKHSY